MKVKEYRKALADIKHLSPFKHDRRRHSFEAKQRHLRQARPSSPPATDPARAIDGEYGAQVEDDQALPNGHGATVNDSSVSDRFRDLGRRTAVKSKKLVRLDDETSDGVHAHREGDLAMESISSDLAFNPDLLALQDRDEVGLIGTTTLSPLKSLVTTVVHPKETIKSKITKTAGRLTKIEHPYLSQQADTELLEAHEALHRAQSATDGSVEEREGAQSESQLAVTRLETRRESLKVAWTTRRYVQRVRVVPKRHIPFPSREKFVDRGPDGSILRFQWERWLGHMLLFLAQDFSEQYIDDFDELPFNADTLRHHVERVVMASAPWQTWLMQVRHIYRWEDPPLSAGWCALYVALWYTEHLVAFVYAWIIYIVVHNHFFPTTVKSLQESLDRSRDRGRTAAKVGELVDKHGSDDWIGPLVDHLGPWLQLQLGDVANILEVLSNFYHWKSPKKTIASLIFIASCLTVCLVADMGFCVKILTFICGGAFFVCWPVASYYPKYRYLLSPVKWVLWDIPTDAEWSFQYLRQQAQVKREQLIAQTVEDEVASERGDRVAKSDDRSRAAPSVNIDGAGDHALGAAPPNGDTDSDDEWCAASSGGTVLDQADLHAIRCRWNGQGGELIVYSEGIRFVPRRSQTERWRRTFQEMTEMRKVRGSTSSKVRGFPSKLELGFTDGEVVLLGMKDRDEAFNTIIGFSSLQWQALQTTGEDRLSEVGSTAGQINSDR